MSENVRKCQHCLSHIWGWKESLKSHLQIDIWLLQPSWVPDHKSPRSLGQCWPSVTCVLGTGNSHEHKGDTPSGDSPPSVTYGETLCPSETSFVIQFKLEVYSFKDVIYLSYCILLPTNFIGNVYAQKLIDSEMRFSLKPGRIK